MFELTDKEKRLFEKLSSSIKIQDFLDTLPINFEKKGETHYSPRRVLREKKAHCIEAALLAAAILWFHKERPLLLDLKTTREDDGHVVALYKRKGYWGAISKSNHTMLRYRDPIYKTIRELAISYFNEYYWPEDGRKTLRSYSKPLDLRSLGDKWVTNEKNLWYIDRMLEKLPHYPLVPKKNLRLVRKADHMERNTGKMIEWKRRNPRT